MARNTRIILGEHFTQSIDTRMTQGRFNSFIEAPNPGLRSLEAQELDNLRKKLAEGEAQLDNGQGVDAEPFMQQLIKQYE